MASILHLRHPELSENQSSFSKAKFCALDNARLLHTDNLAGASVIWHYLSESAKSQSLWHRRYKDMRHPLSHLSLYWPLDQLLTWGQPVTVKHQVCEDFEDKANVIYTRLVWSHMHTNLFCPDCYHESGICKDKTQTSDPHLSGMPADYSKEGSKVDGNMSYLLQL